MINISWMADAPCAGKLDLFFEETRQTVVRAARKICNECGAKEQCLDYALENQEIGVWAGTTTNQRAKILRKRTKELKKAQHYTPAV